MIFALGACADGTVQVGKVTDETGAALANEDGCVSQEEFTALRTGMSFSNALIILGHNWEKLSESEIADIHTSMYMWDGCGSGSNMNAIFQDGELVQKAQFGLRSNGKPAVVPTTTTTSPAQAAAAEAARKQYIADNGFGACRYNLEGVGPYVDYTTLGDCRDSKRGTFKAGATYAQVDAENLAIINASMVRCTLPDGTVFPKDTKEHCAVLKGRVG